MSNKSDFGVQMSKRTQRSNPHLPGAPAKAARKHVSRLIEDDCEPESYAVALPYKRRTSVPRSDEDDVQKSANLSRYLARRAGL